MSQDDGTDADAGVLAHRSGLEYITVVCCRIQDQQGTVEPSEQKGKRSLTWS